MRIVVNNIAASKGGAMTVLKDFYNCVCENDKENEWIFLLGDKYFEETENVKIITLPEIKKSSIKKVMFDFFKGKKFIHNLKPDVVFNMQNIITFGVKVPQIVYLHQSISLQSVKKFSFFKKSERKIAFIQYVIGAIIKRSVRKSDKVIVQTQWMKDAVCKKCGLPQEKVLQILPNVNNISGYKDISAFDNKKFFYPTSTAVYKNNKCVFDACEKLQKDGFDFGVTLTLPGQYSKPNIDCIGRIPYEEVLKKYNESTLVFPSYIETFGYPLAEARQIGTIILAADTEFSRELLNGYENAYFFNPFNYEELAELIKKVLIGEIAIKESKVVLKTREDSWKKVMECLFNA